MYGDLVIGGYYWVIPAPHSESPSARQRVAKMGSRADWQDEMQPSRFNGWNANGEMIWNFIGTDDSWNWPVIWIGRPIELPVVSINRRRSAWDGRLTKSDSHETAYD